MIKHGMSSTTEHVIWKQMRFRCSNPNATNWHRYGGRGIRVCERWNSFSNFYYDMGPRPEGMSLERINLDGNYEPSNCKWATSKEQANNTSTNVNVEHAGETLTVSQWAERLGILPNTLQYRLYRGWTVGEALERDKKTASKKRRKTLQPTRLLKGALLDYVLSEVSSGRTQTAVALEVGIHSSAVSRACKQDKEKNIE